ncbi:MAG: hypothetical protein MZU97_09920 [Bacillus subtilis]|nr:hypothetical protein [Bacillus subtilis]
MTRERVPDDQDARLRRIRHPRDDHAERNLRRRHRREASFPPNPTTNPTITTWPTAPPPASKTICTADTWPIRRFAVAGATFTSNGMIALFDYLDQILAGNGGN